MTQKSGEEIDAIKTDKLPMKIFLFLPVIAFMALAFLYFGPGQDMNPHGGGFILALFTTGFSGIVLLIELVVVPVAVGAIIQDISLRTVSNIALVTVGLFYLLSALVLACYVIFYL